MVNISILELIKYACYELVRQSAHYGKGVSLAYVLPLYGEHKPQYTASNGDVFDASCMEVSTYVGASSIKVTFMENQFNFDSEHHVSFILDEDSEDYKKIFA